MKDFLLNSIGFLSCALLLSACNFPSLSQLQPSDKKSVVNTPSPMTHSMQIHSEKDFILLMIPHHEEAVETSKLLVASASDEELKKFANDVITLQTKEVVEMKQWLKDWYSEESSTATSYQPMMGDLTSLTGQELEKAYIQGMIVHHQGAIEMAHQVSVLTPRPEVQHMADAIVTVQSKEVEVLQGWLNSQFGMEASQLPNHAGMSH
jgi:uncharacterized protein (DUF305 family)